MVHFTHFSLLFSMGVPFLPYLSLQGRSVQGETLVKLGNKGRGLGRGRARRGQPGCQPPEGQAPEREEQASPWLCWEGKHSPTGI